MKMTSSTLIPFRNQSIGIKLSIGLGLMIGICLLIAAAGHAGFSRLNQQSMAMYEKRLLPVAEFVGMKADLMEARAFLMAMIYERVAENRNKFHDQIEKVSQHLDQTLADYEGAGRINEAERKIIIQFKQVWNEFKNTREKELIPFIQNGETEGALALATGIQAQRITEMRTLINDLIESVKKDSMRELEASQAMSSGLVKTFWVIVILGVAVATFLNLGLTLYITNSLKNVVHLSQKLASGNLNHRLEVISQDEIGQMGEALNQAFEKMQTLVESFRQSTEDLKNSQNQLIQSEKMSAVGHLAAGVAHEINNPLGVILGFTQGLIKRISPGDASETALKSIEREAIRCKQLIHELLIFSRAGAGEKEAVDLKEMIEGAIALMLSQIKKHQVSTFKEFDENLPKLQANRGEIQQVIINIIENAIDSMPQGGNLYVRLKKGIFDQEDGFQIEIQDTGMGIPVEIQNKIFNPFFTTKEIGQGTGLGLSTAYEIVQKHGGKITVTSAVGTGTTFTVYFPFA